MLHSRNLVTGSNPLIHWFAKMMCSQNAKSSPLPPQVSAWSKLNTTFEHFCFWHSTLTLLFPAVTIGGQMFLHFLHVYGTFTTRRKIKAAWKECKQPSDFRLQGDLLEYASIHNATHFYMWILQSLRHRGTEANRQIYFVTSILMFRGFSRRGCDMFSKFSITLPVRTFDAMRLEQVTNEEMISR